MSRRGVLLSAAAFATLASEHAAAQPDPRPWPVRQTRIVVPSAPGGSLDIPSRIITERLSRRLRATFIVENKPGAGSAIGTMEVVRAPPDGATLLTTSSAVTILPILQPRLGLDAVRDLEPVSLLMDMPVGILVGPNSPFRDLGDLIAKAKAQPGRFTYGSGGVGTSVHLGAALFASMAGIELLHVPYAGGARVMTAVYAGEVDMYIGNTIELLPAARQGGARLLAVATAQRMPQVPDVPIVADFVPGYDMVQWAGLFAPKGTPPTVIERLVGELLLLRDDAELKARLADGGIVRFDGPGPLAERMAREPTLWRSVIARENIRAE
jgi:tripartite-type tricarboxylate transporter receptor subunit TctC